MNSSKPLIERILRVALLLLLGLTLVWTVWQALTPLPVFTGQLAGTDLVVIAEDIDPGPAWYIERWSWSPEGKYAAFVDYSRNRALCRLEISTQDRRCIARKYLGLTIRTWYSDPHWSPAGRYIAFWDSAKAASHCPSVSLKVIAANLLELSVTTIRGQVMESHWSPDGRRLAFLEIGRGCPESGMRRGRIGIRDMTTAETRYITDWLGPYDARQILGHSPWSPDGSQLAFIRNEASIRLPLRSTRFE